MNQRLMVAVIFLCMTLFSFDQQQTAGHQITYSYQQESIGYSDMQQIYASDTTTVKNYFFQHPGLQELKANMRCLITRTVLEKKGDTLLIAYEIKNPEISIIQNGREAPTGQLKNELTHPVFVTQATNGKIGSIRADAAISKYAVTMQKEIISRLQFVRPEKKSSDWQTTEMNSFGEYRAAYHKIQSPAANNEYEKTNMGYLRGPVLRSNEKIINIGKSVICIDNLQLIQSLNNSETLMSMMGADTISLSGTKITIRIQATENPDLKSMDDYRRMLAKDEYQNRSALAVILTGDEIRTLAYQHTLGNDSWESLIKLLASDTTLDKEANEKLTMKFRALAFLHPDDCKKIGALLSTLAFNTREFKILSHALARTDTYTATDVLSSLIEKKKSEEKMMMEWLPVLATTPAPTEDAVAVCRLLGFEESTVSNTAIRSTAQLALGGIAYHYRIIDSAKATKISLYLLDKMRSEKDTLQQLLVLGNTGSSLILPMLQAYLSKPLLPDSYKSAAIQAMRYIENPAIEQILHNMKQNQDSIIQMAASETLDFRSSER